jgi:hypothetical protein
MRVDNQIDFRLGLAIARRKPYPCGVVLNPVVECCLDLRGSAISHPPESDGSW